MLLGTDDFNLPGIEFHSLNMIFWTVVIRILSNHCDPLLPGSLSLGNKTILCYCPLDRRNLQVFVGVLRMLNICCHFC